MGILTRSATLPYATTDAATLIATARRLLLDPIEMGPIRLVGVGFSGLSEVQQESLFPDLELIRRRCPTPSATRRRPGHRDAAGLADRRRRRPRHFGHGWVQGAGHGVMTVRFETRGTGPGPVYTLREHDPDIARANPVDSLDWPDYVDALAARNRSAGDIEPSQPQRARTSATGEPAASAAISRTRACGGRSRGTITAPASASSRPGP